MSGIEERSAGWPDPNVRERARLDAERAFRIASALLRLGFSRSATEGILGTNDNDLVERQLAYLPFRDARDPAAFLLAAIRGDYSRPHAFPPGRAARLDPYRQVSPALETAPANPYLAAPHAEADPEPTLDLSSLDEGAEPPARLPDAGAVGHGASGAPGPDPLDGGMEPDGEADDPELPGPDGEDG